MARSTSPVTVASAQTEAAPVEFVGIATSSLRWSDFTPYDFQTDKGVWVRLHDMQFVGFDYQVLPPTLTMGSSGTVSVSTNTT